jgi:addiction module HigA family antidote
MPRTPIHPGEILADELKYRGLNTTELANATQIQSDHLVQILSGNRDITTDTAQRLSHYFGTSPNLWTNLQATHDQDQGLIRG